MHMSQLLSCILSVSPVLLAAPSPPFGTTPIPDHSFGTPGVNATFDYVIVGGGTAGLTIASRLAADSSITVAVIEAGGFYEADNGNISVVPGYSTVYAGTDPADLNPAIDWGFVTTPQAGANNRRLHYARGKTLGGSSARHFLYYHRQTLGSAQKWAVDTEDRSYTFSQMSPFYKKSVAYSPPPDIYNNSTNEQDPFSFDPNGGPLHVSHGRYNDPFATWVLPALRAIGQTAIRGLQSGNLLGYAYVPITTDPSKATRSSSESSFLRTASRQTDLKVYNNTLAQSLLFTNNVAKGVLVSSTGTSDYILSAKQEVIVSAGTFQSPQLLMVSGIGPRDILESHGIPIIKALPGVGQNLWDQTWFGTTFRVNFPTVSAGFNDPAVAAAAIQAYTESASGPLTLSGTGVLGFERLPKNLMQTLSPSTQNTLNEAFPSDWPYLEFLPVSAYIGNHSNYVTADPRDGSNYASFATALVAPLSRGNISINNPRMSDPPLINPNYLTHPADIDLAIAAFKRQRQAWASIQNITIGREAYPGPEVQTDAQILDYVRGNLAPVWHAAATCKMGSKGDPMAVVDSKARVWGVEGLRVVDASAFPFLPPGHPQATVYALAEKIAGEILGGRGRGRGVDSE